MGTNQQMIDQMPADQIYEEMFHVLDGKQQGSISKEELVYATKCMGSKMTVNELIKELSPSHSGILNLSEFVMVMKHIEAVQNQPTVLPSIHNDPSVQDLGDISRSPSFAGMSDAASAFSQDKKKFGALLPRTGVYFLPDERVMAFLKLVNQMRKKYEGD